MAETIKVTFCISFTVKAGGVPHQVTLFTAFRAGVGNVLVSLLVDGDDGDWGASGLGIPSR